MTATQVGDLGEPEPALPLPSVLHAYKVYLPESFGGIVTAIGDICAATGARYRHHIMVCSRRDGTQEPIGGAVVEGVRSFGQWLSLPLAPAYPLRFRRRASEHELIALHAPFPLADLVLGLGLTGERPFVVHWHADIVTQRHLRPLILPLIARTLARARAIIVSDASLVETVPLLRRFAAKCRVVPFGVDADALSLPPEDEPRVAALRHQHPGLVLACGRLVPYKGFDRLIWAAALRSFPLWIVGDGPERDRLEILVRDLGLTDRVVLLGALPDAELRRLLHAATVFAMPSLTAAETFGLAQLEAMAVGLPVVNTALDTAVPKVARHGLEALTVPPDDPEALAQAIATLRADPALADRLGRAGRERAAASSTSPAS